MSRLILSVVLCVTLVPTLAAQGPRLDRYGDPLPEGAIARLGSMRFRPGSTVATFVAFAPDGKYLVVNVEREECDTFYGFDSQTGKKTLEVKLPRQGKFQRLEHFYFSPDGSKLSVAGYAEGAAIMAQIDLRAQKAVSRKQFPSKDLARALLVPESGKLLVTLNDRKAVTVLDGETEKEMFQILGGRGLDIAINRKGTRLATAAYEGGPIRIYDATDGKPLREIPLEKERAGDVYFSPDARSIALRSFADEKYVLTSWETDTGKMKFKRHYKRWFNLHFSPDGKLIVLWDVLEGCHFVDVETGKTIKKLQPLWMFPRGFSANGKLLAVESPGAIALINVETGNRLSQLPEPFGRCSIEGFMNDCRHVLMATDEGISLYDANTGERLRHYAFGDMSMRVRSLSPDASMIASRRIYDNHLYIHDVKDGKPIQKWPIGEYGPDSFIFGSDNRTVITAEQKSVKVRDLKDSKIINEIAGFDGIPNLLLATKDGRRLVTAGSFDYNGRETHVRLWNLMTGKEIQRFAPPPEGLGVLQFSPDEQLLAAAGGDHEKQLGFVQVWDVRKNHIWRSWSQLSGVPRSLAFSPDGRTLTTGDPKGQLAIWELATARKRYQVKGHTDYIYGFALSPDGRRLAAASPDAPAYVWDVLGNLTSPPRKLSAADLDKSWLDLAGDDAEAAFRAIRALVGDPAAGVAMLRERLKPASKPNPDRVKQLLTILTEGAFAERNKASKELDQLAATNQELLKKAMEAADNLELKRRLEKILVRLESGTPESLRAIRGVETLEWIGTAEARALIEELANGGAEAVLTQEAGKTLARMRKKTELNQ